jgi:hypothetical protein
MLSARALAAQLSGGASADPSRGAEAAAIPEYFGMKNLQSRIKQYALASGQSKLTDYLRQFEKDQAQQALNISDDEASDGSLNVDDDDGDST